MGPNETVAYVAGNVSRPFAADTDARSDCAHATP